MDFKYSEDEKYFADMFCEGDVNKLRTKFKESFDFRSVTIKRREFNGKRKTLFPIISERANGTCQICKSAEGNELDHIIPLGSNYLNKKFRKMKPLRVGGKLKKVPSESYGSNNIRNLQLACKPCNRKKWYRF